MSTHAMRKAYAATGPFATAVVEVSRDSETGAHEHELRVRSACGALTAQGAPDDVVARVGERLSEPPGQVSPVARLVVATADEVVLEEPPGCAPTSRPRRGRRCPTWGRG